MAKVIAVDVDGTLTEDACWTEEDCLNAIPRQNIIDLVNDWHRTNFIVIHTARTYELYNATIEWLNLNGVKYHAVCMGKMPADLYLDDKAMNPDFIIRSGRW